MREKLTRRDFFKFSAATSISSLLPKRPIEEREDGKVPTNELVGEILKKTSPLAFDALGNLTLVSEEPNGKDKPLMVIPTEIGKKHRTINKLVEEVKLMVFHYDGAPRLRTWGTPRTARNTLYGLDGNGSSVNWCVDEFPIKPEGNKDTGFGILQTQEASGEPKRPYQARHVLIGVELETGRPDINRLKTLERFNSLGITSKLQDLVELGTKDVDKYSVGLEQIGWYFSRNFPENFPPPRQIANVLSLTLAAMRKYSLGPWDIVGHHEIQEKPDPGAEFMATLRFLIGVYVYKNVASRGFILEHSKSFFNYFVQIEEYFKITQGDSRFKIWDEYLGFTKFVEGIGYFPEWKLRHIIPA